MLQELKQLSAPAVDFLKDLLQREPTRRPSAQESLVHPWVMDEAGAANLPLGGSVVQVIVSSVLYLKVVNNKF